MKTFRRLKNSVKRKLAISSKEVLLSSLGPHEPLLIYELSQGSETETVVIASRRAAELLSYYYNDYYLLVESIATRRTVGNLIDPSVDDLMESSQAPAPGYEPPLVVSTTGGNCEVRSRGIRLSLSQRNPLTISTTTATIWRLGYSTQGFMLKYLDLEPNSSQEPVIVAEIYDPRDHELQREVLIFPNNERKRQLSNDVRPSIDNSTHRPCPIMINCLFNGSIHDLPIEILQYCFSLLPGDQSDFNAKKSLTLVCKRWDLGLDFFRSLSQRPQREEGKTLARLLRKATYNQELWAVFACQGLRVVQMDLNSWDQTSQPESQEVYLFLETLFRLSNLESLTITGRLLSTSSSPSSSGDATLPSDPHREDRLAIRSRIWNDATRKHKLRYLRLGWGKEVLALGGGEKSNTNNGEPRWNSVDLLSLMPHSMTTSYPDWGFEGADLTFKASKSRAGGIRSIWSLELIDCRLKNQVLSLLFQNLNSLQSFHIQRCMGPGRLSVENIFRFLKTSGRRLERLIIQFWPWTDILFEGGMVNRWLAEHNNDDLGLFPFLFTEIFGLSHLVIDGTYEDLRIFSLPINVHSLQLPYLDTIELDYCSGLRGWDVITIVQNSPQLFFMSVKVFFGEWMIDEITTVRTEFEKIRSEVPSWVATFELLEGFEDVEEEWETHLGEYWGVADAREELDEWERERYERTFERAAFG